MANESVPRRLVSASEIALTSLCFRIEKEENNHLLFIECRWAVAWEGGSRAAETVYLTLPSPKLSQIPETPAHIQNRGPNTSLWGK